MNQLLGSKRAGKIGIVLLAAGASTRMGTPKQLLKIEGVSLLRRAAEHALDSGCGPVVVVLGANADLIMPELEGLALYVTINHNWKLGMSSSITAGLVALLAEAPEIEGVILFLADQPNVTGSSLRKLSAAHVETGSELVAATYSGQIGPPAFFSRFHFEELKSIQGEGGAKYLLQQHASDVVLIDLPEGAIDLDTAQDFAHLTTGASCDRVIK